MCNCQPGAYYAGAGRRVAEADLRYISVSDHPTTDIRETCTHDVLFIGRYLNGASWRHKVSPVCAGGLLSVSVQSWCSLKLLGWQSQVCV